MATQDATEDKGLLEKVGDKLTEIITGTPVPETVAESNGTKPPTDLAAKVAAKRKGASTTISTTEILADSDAGPALSSEASDELARLAAMRGETTSTAGDPVGKGKSKGPKGSTAQPSVPSAGDGTDATASSTDADAEIPTEIPGLTSGGEGGPGNTYAQRQAELKAAREKGGKGKARGKAKGKAKTPAQLEREAKAAEKAAAAKAKEKEKAKSAKQKEKEEARKKAEKEKQAEKKKKEDERKEKLAAQKAERAKERAAKANPDLLKKEPKQIQELFAAHYKSALEDHTRRPKCDRGDFCAGWVTLLKFFRKSGVTLPAKA